MASVDKCSTVVLFREKLNARRVLKWSDVVLSCQQLRFRLFQDDLAKKICHQAKKL